MPMDIASGMAIGKGLFELLRFVKGVAGSGVVSAYFRYDTTKIYGSEKIIVSLNKSDRDEVFWLNVEPIDEYVFVRFPINDAGCEELIGTVVGEVLPNPAYWRWVQSARSGTIVGGNFTPANAKVDFVVVGYKPKAIIQYLSSGN